MDTELDFPPLDTAPAPAAALVTKPAAGIDLKTVDLQAVALAHFEASHAAIKTAKETLKGVVHDLSTPTKLADAKSLRHRVINTPLATARKVSAGLKSKLTAVSAAVGAELKTIEADFEAADKLITPLIEAREQEIAEEKRIAAEKEAARVQAHRDALAKLASPAERAAGPDMTAERIAKGIELVEAITIDRAAWEEFADQAEEQKAVTLERMRALHAKAVSAEAEAARLAAEKAEQERKAAELKAEADRLAAERAEFERQKAELQAEKDRVAAEAQAKADEAARVEREAAEQKAREEAAQAEQNIAAQDSQQVLKAEASTPDATDRDAPVITSPSVGSMGARATADAAPFVAPAPEVRAFHSAVAALRNEQPTLTLGEIKARIAPLSIDAAGLESLGYAATKVKAACMYRESDWPTMRAAMRKVLDTETGAAKVAA